MYNKLDYKQSNLDYLFAEMVYFWLGNAS